MDTWVLVVVSAIFVFLAIASVLAWKSLRRSELQQRFGSEYDRTVDEADSRRDAERALRDREARHAMLELHPLTTTARQRYERDWMALQARFVDRPQVAVADADGMIANVMRDLGYPVDDFESNADLMSVEHADVVDRYREGHGIYAKTVDGTATTEDLRQAVIAYRALFEELMRESAEAESGA